MEEIECVHLYLDDLGAPRQSKIGRDLSIVGRIQQLELSHFKKLSEIETSTTASIN